MLQEYEAEMEAFDNEKEILKSCLEETIQKRTDEIYNIDRITNIEETYYM